VPASALYLQRFAKTHPNLLTPPSKPQSANEPTILSPVYIDPSAEVDPSAKIGPNVSLGEIVVNILCTFRDPADRLIQVRMYALDLVYASRTAY
jgi:hypothetical protein